jgi:hypothetical protein
VLTVLGTVLLRYRRPDGAGHGEVPGLGYDTRTVLAVLALNPHGADESKVAAALAAGGGSADRVDAGVADLNSWARAAVTELVTDLVGVLEGGGFGLRRELVTVDVRRVGALLAWHRDNPPGPERSLALDAIAHAYPADLADELGVTWAHPHREALRRDVLDAHADAVAELGDPARQLPLLERMCRIDPLSEHAHSDLADAQESVGAAGAPERTRARLAKALAVAGATPSSWTAEFLGNPAGTALPSG